MYEILECKERISIEHLFQIWCLYLSYKENYEQNTADVSFLDIYDNLHYSDIDALVEDIESDGVIDDSESDGMVQTEVCMPLFCTCRRQVLW